KNFTFRLRIEIKEDKLSKIAFYADIDIDFVASEMPDTINLEGFPISRFKFLVEDFFYAIEYVSAFPTFPDFSNYAEVEVPSIFEQIEIPLPGSPAPYDEMYF